MDNYSGFPNSGRVSFRDFYERDSNYIEVRKPAPKKLTRRERIVKRLKSLVGRKKDN